MTIHKYGADALHRVADPVQGFDAGLKQLADDMYETMLDADGIGLAAPQVGRSIRLIVVDTQQEEGVGRLNLVNPEFTPLDESLIEMNEGCLSIPGTFCAITRPERIQVSAQRLNGKPIRFQADGLLARVIQHEIDHLDGKLFVERVEDPVLREELRDVYEAIEMGLTELKSEADKEPVTTPA